MNTTPSPTNQPATSDDRNLVSVENDQPGLSLEDRLFLFWKNYRNALLVAVAIVVGSIVGREVWRNFAASRELAVGQAFGAAESIEARQAFVLKHGGHPLAGAAMLLIADEHYKNGDFGLAASAYEEAAGVATDSVLAARARLGSGVAHIQAGRSSEGSAILRQLNDDSNALESIRTESRFHLAALAVASGDMTQAREDLDALVQMGAAQAWAQQIMLLESQVAAAQVGE